MEFQNRVNYRFLAATSRPCSDNTHIVGYFMFRKLLMFPDLVIYDVFYFRTLYHVVNLNESLLISFLNH